MKARFHIIFLAGLFAMLCSCTSPSLDRYAGNKPSLKLEDFFQGQLEAQGVVKNRAGEVTRYFTANINAYWSQGIGTLDESFVFNDGEHQQRIWTLTPTADGYQARAGDVKGPGQAKVNGNAMNMHYQLEVAYKGSPLILSVDDWMWLVDQNTLLNESTLRKWGIKVGSIQLVIKRLPQD